MSILINALLAAVTYGALGTFYAVLLLGPIAVVAAALFLLARARGGTRHHTPIRHGRHAYQTH